MKKMFRKASLVLSALVVALGLTACDDKEEKTTEQKELVDYTDYEAYDYVNENPSVSVATAGTAESFVGLDYAERAVILGKLEEYAMKNAISGIVLYDNGGYVKYADRVKFGTDPKKDSNGNVMEIGGTPQYNYITGYGFGIVSEGGVEGKLSGFADDYKYASYYHTFETEDPKTLNYMNDKGSVVGGYTGYVFSGYFGTKMNETKDGYVWYASTATDVNKVGDDFRPLPLNADGTINTEATAKTVSTKYRIYVKTGADLTYATASTNPAIAAYNGREVALEDYLTPFKELFNQSNALARGAESLTGAGSIKGMEAYHAATANGFDQAAWNNVGIKAGTDATGSYLDFELNVGATPFYAMYYLSSSLYAPIPAAFLEEIGGIKVWGSFNEDNSLSPVDTTLSTGVFVVEQWTQDGQFVFKNNKALNPAVKGGEQCYTIDGLHVNILKAQLTDNLAAWKEYEAGKLDSVGIPKDKLASEKGTKGTQTTAGSSSTKLNVNTCTEEEWEKYFGVNGTITQTPESEYWDVEPAMSNENFVLGLSWAINRAEFAASLGATPSIEYFTNNYLSDPEAGTSYNSTEPHKAAMESVYGKTWADTYGYNYDIAIENFSKAAKYWLDNGIYKEGDIINIEVAWQTQASIKTSGEPIEKYLEEAFNDSAVCGNKLTLNIQNTYVEVWSDIYYKKMMVGQFDIALGGISGNPLNPLNFMEVLKSDNTSGFTLNWGPDTNGTADIEYNDKMWTFDALWKAADAGAVVTTDGKLAANTDADLVKNVRNEDGSRTIVIKFGAANIANVVKTELTDVVVCWYGGEYDEFSVKDSMTVEGDTITFTVSKEQAEGYQGDIGIDLYFAVTVNGETAEEYQSLYSAFPILDLDYE